MAMRVNPFSALPRAFSRAFLARIQRTPLYRAVSSDKVLRVEILEAHGADLDEAQRVFGLEVKPAPPEDRDAVNLVAKKAENIVGFAQLVRHSYGGKPDTGYFLFSLNVRSLYRGLGIGRRLTEQVMVRAKAEGARDLSVITREGNRIALALFGQLGFQIKTPPAFGDELSLQGGKNVILVKPLIHWKL